MTSVVDKTDRYRNIILCEDIRDEVGNKKSLMGMIGGDVLVASFPATIKVAFYLEYLVQPYDGGRFGAEFRLFEGDTEIASGKFEANEVVGPIAAMVVPTGLLRVDKETAFSLRIAVNGRPEQEILGRKVLREE